MIALMLLLQMQLAMAQGPYFPPGSRYKHANATMIIWRAFFDVAALYLDTHSSAAVDARLSCPWAPGAVRGIACYANASIHSARDSAGSFKLIGRAVERMGRIPSARDQLRIAMINHYWAQLNSSLYATHLAMAQMGYLRNACDRAGFPWLGPDCGNLWVISFTEMIKQGYRLKATQSDALRYVFT